MKGIVALLVGFCLGWIAHGYWVKPIVITKTLPLPSLKPVVSKLPTIVPASNLKPALIPIDNTIETLMTQSQADVAKGDYLSALDAIEQLLVQVQDVYPQTQLEQRFIEISNLYLQQLGDTNIITKKEFLFKAIDIFPNHLQFRYWLSQLMIVLEDYENASYHLSFLANNIRWKSKFDSLTRAINYAQIFEQGEIEIPLIQRTNAWHIEVMVDDTLARLILDTGASVTTLSEHLIANDYPHLGNVTLSTANGKIDAFRVDIRTLSVGAVIRHQFPVVVLPKEKLPVDIDGLLGLDWLAEFHFVIDKKNQRLRLIPFSKIK